jgi:hypothetical protein
MFSKLWRQLSRKPRLSGRHAARRPKLLLELLEDRALPSVDFAQLASGLNQILPALQNKVNSDIYSVNMPMIGTGLSSAPIPADAEFLDAVNTRFQNALSALPTNRTLANVKAALQPAFGSLTMLQSDPTSNETIRATPIRPRTPSPPTR